MCCGLRAGTCASACLGVPGSWCRLAWPPFLRGWTTRMSSLLLMDPSSGHYKSTCTLNTLQRTNTNNTIQIFPEKELGSHICLWAIYIFPRSICLVCWRKYVDRSCEKSLTDTWMLNLGLRPRNSQKRKHKWDFLCSVLISWLVIFAEFIARNCMFMSVFKFKFHQRIQSPTKILLQLFKNYVHNLFLQSVSAAKRVFSFLIVKNIILSAECSRAIMRMCSSQLSGSLFEAL